MFEFRIGGSFVTLALTSLLALDIFRIKVTRSYAAYRLVLSSGKEPNTTMDSDGGEIPCFRGLVIHCNAFLDDGMPMALQNAIENNGGTYSSKLIPSRVTHVVWRNGNNSTIRAAERNNIHIVGPSWIHESVKVCK